MCKVIVIIPVYKKSLNESELKSIKRTVAILSGHEICLLAPLGLDLTEYLNIYPQFKYVFFDKSYFNNIAGYNKLMMSPNFYAAFNGYDYLLICQLDVYVFEDQLSYWCKKGYDYIGAPWISLPPRTGNKKPLIDFSRRMLNTVGNGGFSLRKIETHLRIAKRMSFFAKVFPKNEDFFWCYIIPKLFKYKRPSLKEALSFAFELSPSIAFMMNDEKLPFAVHAWEKYEPEFWRKYIH